jgi:hypothetical protein
MTNSDWWDRAKLPPRPQPIEIRKRETICTLCNHQHQATLETRVVHGVGQELIFSINGHWRRMRVFWSGRSPSLDEAIAATKLWLAQSGYERVPS